MKPKNKNIVTLSMPKGLIFHSILLTFILAMSCNKFCKNSPPPGELEGVAIPYSVFTLTNHNDTVFHLGTFDLYHFWDSLNKVQNQPTGYVGYIHFNDTSLYKKTLGFIPYDLQGIYEIPIHIERGLIPYLESKDKSIKDIKVLDDKIIFKTLNADKWRSLKLVIYAKHNTW